MPEFGSVARKMDHGQRSPHKTKLALILVMIALDIGCSGPPLTSSEAARVISQTAEFKSIRKLVNVESLTDTGEAMDHWDHCCYFGEFTFEFLTRQPNIAAGVPVHADAEFRYWEGQWHLQQFRYKSSGKVVIVDSEQSPDDRRIPKQR